VEKEEEEERRDFYAEQDSQGDNRWVREIWEMCRHEWAALLRGHRLSLVLEVGAEHAP
jgi:hypothetical protein